MKLVKEIIILNTLLLINSCGGGSTTTSVTQSTNEILKNQSEEIILEEEAKLELINGTSLFGSVLDTSYNSIEDAIIFTSPQTLEVKTDESGDFVLVSTDFKDDIPYIITIEHSNFLKKEITNFYPEVDEENELGIQLLTPKETINLEDGEVAPRMESSGLPMKE